MSIARDYNYSTLGGSLAQIKQQCSEFEMTNHVRSHLHFQSLLGFFSSIFFKTFCPDLSNFQPIPLVWLILCLVFFVLGLLLLFMFSFKQCYTCSTRSMYSQTFVLRICQVLLNVVSLSLFAYQFKMDILLSLTFTCLSVMYYGSVLVFRHLPNLGPDFAFYVVSLLIAAVVTRTDNVYILVSGILIEISSHFMLVAKLLFFQKERKVQGKKFQIFFTLIFRIASLLLSILYLVFYYKISNTFVLITLFWTIITYSISLAFVFFFGQNHTIWLFIAIAETISIFICLVFNLVMNYEQTIVFFYSI